MIKIMSFQKIIVIRVMSFEKNPADEVISVSSLLALFSMDSSWPVRSQGTVWQFFLSQ